MNYCLECGDAIPADRYFCSSHNRIGKPVAQIKKEEMSSLYPKYFKDVSNLTEVDVYILHHLFNIQDPSGAIQHASKKLLLSGVRTGGKSKREDIKEARDTLTRWLQIDEQMNPV